MHAVIRRRAWWLRAHDDDRGAVATIFAILLGGGVLLGMTALTVDVGQIYVERQELQSGADSAAAAIARECAAKGIDTCRADANSIAAQYANANAKDGQSAVLVACVNDGTQGSCAPVRGNLTDCIEPIPAGSPYVEVHTGTRQKGGDLLLPSFARGLAGNTDYQGVDVAACARSKWVTVPTGSPSGITISNCEYQKSISSGSSGTIVHVHYRHTVSSDCGTETSGFGFVKGPDGCVTPPGTAAGSKIYDSEYNDPNYNTPQSQIAADCEAVLKHSLDTKTPILIPVFTEWQYVGSPVARKWYNVAGMAGFVVTGYAGVPGIPTSRSEGDCDCMQGQSCLYGYFLPGYGPGTGN
ncbi:MAG: hypothetical protein JWO79_4702 [Actinomycetia bacterium]|nr:hypothetical protein [Actinomycetes bacterium]MDQ1654408.1 hypothetical protein [Cryptosporangiaceae bacterium]